MNQTTGSTAAASLEGLRLPNGWIVAERLDRADGRTGGQYSVSYLVANGSGAKGFLKALDYSRAFKAPDRALALNSLTAAYLHERTILERCAKRKLRRVVLALDHGSINVKDFELGVDYIIFERAEGDLRAQMDAMDEIDDLWRLKTLHQIATGLFELHTSNIAHQDVKPSNVLNFEGEGKKLGDLGRSACREIPCPYDDDVVPGTRAYAPPELLYAHAGADFASRRFGCDAYLLGSMVVYLFTGCGATTALLSLLNPVHRPDQWKDGFVTVLPYLRKAFGELLAETEPLFTAPIFGKELLSVIAQLCEPDPGLRGDPLYRRRRENQYSLERYVSKFDYLCRRLETSVLREH